MKLDDYIKKVLSESPEGPVHFEIFLEPDGTVRAGDTGNKITLDVYNYPGKLFEKEKHE